MPMLAPQGLRTQTIQNMYTTVCPIRILAMPPALSEISPARQGMKNTWAHVSVKPNTNFSKHPKISQVTSSVAVLLVVLPARG